MSFSRTNSKVPESPHFFKVMMPGFRNTLSIPLAFCKHLKGEKSNEAVIKTPKGLWHVKIGKGRNGQFYFEEGWSKFVQKHDLNIGEFVVFEYKGNLHFQAQVYDYSCCEKEFPVDNSGSKSKDEKRKTLHVQDASKKRAKIDKSKIDSLISVHSHSSETVYF